MKSKVAMRPNSDDDSDDSTELEPGDEIDDKVYGDRKPAAVARRESELEGPAELRVTLMKAEERLVRAERQVRVISKTQITDAFIEGQVRSWTKETLWKKCKFITNDKTMEKVMKLASEHFKVPAFEQQHWMSTFAHIVRDGLNQKRNACTQDLRKSIKSK